MPKSNLNRLLVVTVAILEVCCFAGMPSARMAAVFTVHKIYGNHMILQRGRPIRIGGSAAPGEAVRVTIGSNTVHAVAGIDGEWCAELPAMEAGMQPYTVTVSGAEGVPEIVFQDVLIGEVWLASGQSNMEMPVYSGRPFWNALNGEKEAAAAEHPGIRLFNMALCRSVSPGVEQKEVSGPGWQVCSSQSAASFSAVGYFFARRLFGELKVPVGIINSSWGGTPIQSWISETGYRYANRSGELSAIEDVRTPLSSERKAYLAQLRKELKMATEAWRKRFDESSSAYSAKAEAWKAPEFDDSDWTEENIAGQPAYDFDGVFWYRRTVILPAGWAGQELVLSLGVIDDCDETFFNGERIGATGPETPAHWKTPRTYSVPGKLVRKGGNVIAIRVTDYGSIGGVKGPPKQIYLQEENNERMKVPLSGNWKYKVEFKADLKEIGNRPIPPDGCLIAPDSPHFPATLYNSMIAPWTNYPIRGIIWYQGESDVGFSERYMTLFPLLIRDWRRAWQEPDMPFLFVQLAPLEHHMPSLPGPDGFWKTRQPGDSDLAELREVQAATLKLPNTGMAVTIDIGDPYNVHPANKQTVAERLAAEAGRLCYDYSVVSSGPIYDRMQIEGGKIRLFFRNIGSGLTAHGARLTSFAIAGPDGCFVWADAEIEGDTVVVSSDKIASPTAVRYAWAAYPGNANLYNREGFPAVPFRTDRPGYLLQ